MCLYKGYMQGLIALSWSRSGKQKLHPEDQKEGRKEKKRKHKSKHEKHSKEKKERKDRKEKKEKRRRTEPEEPATVSSFSFTFLLYRPVHTNST